MIRTIAIFLIGLFAWGQYTPPVFATSYRPSGATTSTTLQNRLDFMGVRPENYGAKADNATSDSAAIMAADTAAIAAGSRVYFTPGKTYYCATAVTTKGHIDGAESFVRFATDFTGTAWTIGDTGGTYTTAKKIRLPRVNMNKSDYNNWNAVPNSIAVRLINVENCDIYLAGASGFANGVWLDATAGKGASYNRFTLGDFIDNKIAIRVEATSSTGWVNQNSWFGGRIQVSSGAGTNVPGTRGVLLKTWATANAVTTTQSLQMTSGTYTVTWAGGDFTAAGFYKGGQITFAGFANAGNNKTFRVETVGTTTLTLASNSVGLVSEGPTASVTASMDGAPFGYLENANNFYGTSIETAPLEAVFEIRGGWFNNFFGCRYEQTASPTAIFSGMGANASTKYNLISGGYTAGGNDFVRKDGVYTSSNRVEVGERMAISNSGSYGPYQYSNVGSDTYPFLTIWPNASGESVLAKPTGTGWLAQYGGYYADFKATGNTVPLIRIASQTGSIAFGDGTTALTTNRFKVFGANTGIQQEAGWFVLPGSTGNTLRITAGVANSTVAVTLGSTGPTGSTAGAPQGWMRISVNGTDRYIPYW